MAIAGGAEPALSEFDVKNIYEGQACLAPLQALWLLCRNVSMMTGALVRRCKLVRSHLIL